MCLQFDTYFAWYPFFYSKCVILLYQPFVYWLQDDLCTSSVFCGTFTMNFSFLFMSPSHSVGDSQLFLQSHADLIIISLSAVCLLCSCTSSLWCVEFSTFCLLTVFGIWSDELSFTGMLLHTSGWDILISSLYIKYKCCVLLSYKTSETIYPEVTLGHRSLYTASGVQLEFYWSPCGQILVLPLSFDRVHKKWYYLQDSWKIL